MGSSWTDLGEPNTSDTYIEALFQSNCSYKPKYKNLDDYVKKTIIPIIDQTGTNKFDIYVPSLCSYCKNGEYINDKYYLTKLNHLFICPVIIKKWENYKKEWINIIMHIYKTEKSSYNKTKPPSYIESNIKPPSYIESNIKPCAPPIEIEGL
jgi:hypothetical protein